MGHVAQAFKFFKFDDRIILIILLIEEKLQALRGGDVRGAENDSALRFKHSVDLAEGPERIDAEMFNYLGKKNGVERIAGEG